MNLSGSPILVSFSGGRTSAFMAQFLKTYYADKNQELIFVYANTGKELEPTLDFVHKCDKEWDLGLVWLEALVTHEKGVGVKHRIIDFKSASRRGQPFEEVIKKYGIPNKAFPHCTRELKQIPIKKYLRSLGLSDWSTAVGIRADEPHRINRGTDSNFKNPIYPVGGDIISVDEAFIRDWWDRQEFDLGTYIPQNLIKEFIDNPENKDEYLEYKEEWWETPMVFSYDDCVASHHLDTKGRKFIPLKDYQNNCDLCWKKSKRKRLTLMAENPGSTEWWKKMEAIYGGDYQFDQRDGITIPEMIELSKQPFRKAVDKHELRKTQGTLFEPDMDMEWDCMCKTS